MAIENSSRVSPYLLLICSCTCTFRRESSSVDMFTREKISVPAGVASGKPDSFGDILNERCGETLEKEAGDSEATSMGDEPIAKPVSVATASAWEERGGEGWGKASLSSPTSGRKVFSKEFQVARVGCGVDMVAENGKEMYFVVANGAFVAAGWESLGLCINCLSQGDICVLQAVVEAISLQLRLNTLPEALFSFHKVISSRKSVMRSGEQVSRRVDSQFLILSEQSNGRILWLSNGRKI